MLVLTRKAGEQILIGKDVLVKILEVQGNRVQLGIEAPKDVKIGSPDAAGKPPEPQKE